MSGILSAPGTRPAGAVVRITGQLIEMLIAGRADLARLVSTQAWQSLADMALDVLDVRFTPPKADIALRVSARPGAARRGATIGGKTAQISQGRHRFRRADGKG